MTRTALMALAAFAMSASTGVQAHSFWLQPVDHTPEAGEEVTVEFKVGDAGDVNDWGLYWERVASFRLYGPDGVVDEQASIRPTQDGAPGSAQVAIAAPGSYILAFESNPSFSDLGALRFNAYVDHERLTAIAAHREATGTNEERGTELYARRAKALLQAGERFSPNVTRPIGQTLEIVPLQNPFALEAGAPLDLQVFWRGEPLGNAQLLAAPLDATGDYEAFTTSTDGVARVTAPGDTPMLYSVVWGVPAPDETRADYFTVFASLTVGTK
jgi:hypothetical protein